MECYLELKGMKYRDIPENIMLSEKDPVTKDHRKCPEQANI